MTSTDRQNFMYTPADLYEKIGFTNIDRMKDYGQLIGKPYTNTDASLNIHLAHEAVFGENLDARYMRREALVDGLKPKTKASIDYKPPKLFAYTLDIGSSAQTKGVIKEFTLTLPIKPKSAGHVNLQVTPVLHNVKHNYHDQIFLNIPYFEITDRVLKVSVAAIRSNNEWWGLWIQGHLLVSIFEEEIRVIV
ncbi:MAG TPA: hypothetical protein VKI61_00940 [Chitinophagaceae bacterium]|nr:hypothetical protein [Chitinophagaceae bacterium]